MTQSITFCPLRENSFETSGCRGGLISGERECGGRSCSGSGGQRAHRYCGVPLLRQSAATQVRRRTEAERRHAVRRAAAWRAVRAGETLEVDQVRRQANVLRRRRHAVTSCLKGSPQRRLAPPRVRLQSTLFHLPY